MPRQTEWGHRLPAILESLQALPAGTLVDRASVEGMFAVSRRQASRILQRLGASSVGGSMVMRAEDLAARLSLLNQGEKIVFEQHRRERLAEKLAAARREIRARKIPIPVPVERFSGLQALPEEIRLEPGELRIRFNTPVELLQRLLQLGQAIADDSPEFERLATRG